jgi:hypothetical protein
MSREANTCRIPQKFGWNRKKGRTWLAWRSLDPEATAKDEAPSRCHGLRLQPKPRMGGSTPEQPNPWLGRLTVVSVPTTTNLHPTTTDANGEMWLSLERSGVNVYDSLLQGCIKAGISISCGPDFDYRHEISFPL